MLPSHSCYWLLQASPLIICSVWLDHLALKLPQSFDKLLIASFSVPLTFHGLVSNQVQAGKPALEFAAGADAAHAGLRFTDHLTRSRALDKAGPGK